ncbi:glycoside hydrolase family 3 N-terminal domain-containing protein [Borreliella burgdorferi]|uniref:glycoside hydrolase family 3 N-terminal domain-containing protein n=1 Tax=Borreliella burgdorferi TaxID=139 RepID=UPI000D02C7E8|nr:glycoside hydrolase family 3 protein [Borreliella burgdorferi]MCD2413316.1 glycoside hydrolase family 3 protein [Borreliella burgdorferi]PRQ91840.1 beta-N-acetylhexosaminidase [Borreliella burgdorferi]PRR14967.1 beta-N-acetylhexosaminidase [Borreliella burgdorferi]PRR16180.1 beta-N-acetylhexosaminidase [Borreliella burgdorferi]PRR19822.1 beta-N-acetylhexosaminidase [Borreliella burgdorferi]
MDFLKTFSFLFFSFFCLNLIAIESLPEIDYEYFNKDKSDLVDLIKFLGELDFQTILKDRNLFIGIRNLTNFKNVQELNIDDINRIKKINPIGIILFRENLKDAEQTKGLINAIKSHIGHDIFIAIDEEGGIVSRASENKKMGVYNFPAMEHVGGVKDLHLIYKIGEVLAKQLRRLGINLNMAPVADIKFAPHTPLLNRTFGGYSAYNIGLMVEAFIDGMQSHGVFSAIKHFPGLGGTTTDTHKYLAFLPYSKSFLMLNNFVPFVFGRAAKFIMIGHVNVPKISKDITSMSKSIVNIIRENLNITSIMMTDSYDMGAITRSFSNIENAIKKSLSSGVNIVLIP